MDLRRGPAHGRRARPPGRDPQRGLRPWHTSGRLYNFLGTTDAGPAAAAAAYRPEDAARLLELKDRFDPHGLFRHGHALKSR